MVLHNLLPLSYTWPSAADLICRWLCLNFVCTGPCLVSSIDSACTLCWSAKPLYRTWPGLWLLFCLLFAPDLSVSYWSGPPDSALCSEPCACQPVPGYIAVWHCLLSVYRWLAGLYHSLSSAAPQSWFNGKPACGNAQGTHLHLSS